MASKYDELYERFIKSGLKIKEFCLSNILNYHNVKLGFFQRRKIKEKNNINEQKVIKVNWNNKELIVNILNLKINIVNKYQDDYENIKNERNEILLPLCNELFSFLQEQYDKCLPSSSIRRALLYALNCKNGFMNVFKDGRLELDNNASERKVKMYVIGRKNWLFANTIKGGEVSCNLYSLLRTAVENDLKPFEYLTYLLDTLIPLNEKERIKIASSLLPWSKDIPDYIKLKDPVVTK